MLCPVWRNYISMSRIRYYFNSAKEYGLINCIKRVLGTIGYTVAAPIYKYYLMRFTKIDEKKIVFCSKPSFSDNSKAMYDYLRSINDKQEYQFVWLIGHKEEIPNVQANDTVFLKRNVMSHSGMTFAALRETATAKYVFFTHNSPFYDFGKKRTEQIVINLWHGCGYKDIQKSATSWIFKNPCDYSLVPGDVFVKTKSGFWGCPEDKILSIGYPRYDYLLNESETAKKYVEQMKGTGEKLIAWMPTFRKTKGGQFPESKIKGQFELPLLDSEEQLEELNCFLKEKNVVLCVKRHPSQLVYKCEKKQLSNICFINNEDLQNADVELYSFLRYTDALISDYSSVTVDYLLLCKPMAFSLDDFEAYKSTRGFVFEDPLCYMPGHHLYGYENMLEFVQDVAEGVDPYAEKRDMVMPEMHHPCDNYSKRVWEKVKNL